MVQNVKFRALFLKKKFVLYLTKILFVVVQRKTRTRLDLLSIPQSGGKLLFFYCLKKNINASRPSEHAPVRMGKCQNISHIQRIGCQPDKTFCCILLLSITLLFTAGQVGGGFVSSSIVDRQDNLFFFWFLGKPENVLRSSSK